MVKGKCKLCAREGRKYILDTVTLGITEHLESYHWSVWDMIRDRLEAQYLEVIEDET